MSMAANTTQTRPGGRVPAEMDLGIAHTAPISVELNDENALCVGASLDDVSRKAGREGRKATATMTAPAHTLPRTHDAMVARFTISARGEHQDIPAQDARRVSAMRRLVRARLEYCRLSILANDVELIISELVTNAGAHSQGTAITMTLALNHGFLHLEVTDETGRRPEIQQPADDAENGRGLILVQAITEQCGGKWGTGPNGTSTWCTIPVPAEGDQ